MLLKELCKTSLTVKIFNRNFEILNFSHNFMYLFIFSVFSFFSLKKKEEKEKGRKAFNSQNFLISGV